MSRFISTTLPYVNGAPHIGHALEFVIVDVLARFHAAVHLHSGTDENSLKNVLAAQAAGVPVADFVAERTAEFRHLAAVLGLELTDFIRTSTDGRHRPFVEWLWHACAAHGDIYRGDYAGRYCVGCEQFYGEDELIDGRCPEHDTVPEWVREPNYFFRLSRYRDRLVDLIASGGLGVQPAAKRHEILAFLESPLQDLSISRRADRAQGWGIPVPGDPGQVIYVWFDALANYVSAPGRDAWAGFDHVTHVAGKGVLRFHAVYWPAMLLSAGLRLPSEVLVHGYVTVEGRKIGKSLGNAIDPLAPVNALGVDAFRYYLLRHVGSVRDGDFAWARFQAVYEHELANQLGNLVARLCALLRQHGPVAEAAEPLTDLRAPVAAAVQAFALHRALDAVWQAVETANAFLSHEQPWHLAGTARQRVLAVAAASVREIGRALAPFLPATAQKIEASLAGRHRAQLFPKLR